MDPLVSWSYFATWKYEKKSEPISDSADLLHSQKIPKTQHNNHQKEKPYLQVHAIQAHHRLNLLEIQFLFYLELFRSQDGNYSLCFKGSVQRLSGTTCMHSSAPELIRIIQMDGREDKMQGGSWQVCSHMMSCFVVVQGKGSHLRRGFLQLLQYQYCFQQIMGIWNPEILKSICTYVNE